jgi:hypothetical protein
MPCAIFLYIVLARYILDYFSIPYWLNLFLVTIASKYHKGENSLMLINQSQSLKFHDGEIQGKKYDGK